MPPDEPKLADPGLLTREQLIDLAFARMPFGRYKGRRLLELPEEYLVWFSREGWPSGKLGAQMAAMLEIKHNGLTHLLQGMVDN